MADEYAQFEPVQASQVADEFAGFEPVGAPAAAVSAVAPASAEPLEQLQSIEALAPKQKPVGDISTALIEPTLTLGSGLAALPASGLAFLGAAGLNSTGLTDIPLKGLVERVQKLLTYEPRTRSGDAGSKVLFYPFEKLAELANFAGKKTTEGLVNAGASENTAAGGGTAVGTAIQLAPSLLLRAAGKKTPAQQQQAAAEAATRARDFVSTRTGLDYDSLAQGTRQTLEAIAADAGRLAKIDPKALERQARLESLDVPIKGRASQIEQDAPALRAEANVSQTNAGKAIRDSDAAQNQGIIDNLVALRQSVSGRGPGAATAQGPEAVGQSVQGALRKKLSDKEAQVDRLYTEARAAGELQGKVSPKPIIEVLTKAADKSDLKWVMSWLRDNKVVVKTPNGTVTNKLSLETLEGLRRDANARVKNGGSDGYQASKIVRAIDKATDGAGGQKYAAARKARREQALEFQEQRSVSRMVDDKSRTDRAVPLEETFNDLVLRGSTQDLRNVKRSLIGDKKTRAEGLKAWRDLRAEAMSFIEREATKGIQRSADGSAPNVSPAALKKAIDRVGADKLNELFGPRTKQRLDNLLEATRDLKTRPASGIAGSDTLANVLNFLERGLNRIPIGGDVLSGTVRAVGQVRELGKAGRLEREAARDPLREAAGTVAGKNKLRQFAPAGTLPAERDR